MVWKKLVVDKIKKAKSSGQQGLVEGMWCQGVEYHKPRIIRLRTLQVRFLR